MKHLKKRSNLLTIKEITLKRLYKHTFTNIYYVNPKSRYPIWIVAFWRQKMLYAKRFGDGANYNYALNEAIKYREDLRDELPEPACPRECRRDRSNSGYYGITIAETVLYDGAGYLITGKATDEYNQKIIKRWFSPFKNNIPLYLDDAIKWQKKTDIKPKLYVKYQPKIKVPFFPKGINR